MEVTTVGVDLAKDVFQAALANRAGRIIGHRRLTRRQFERFFDALPTGTAVVMESCGTAHYWGRRGQAAGLQVRLLPVQYVRPYVRRNKTDRIDAEAILEANRCGEIRSVPVKTSEQHALLALHRIRTQWQTARVARINTMRALLREVRVALQTAPRDPSRLTRLQQWAFTTATRRGRPKATIAIANKLARIVWAVWCREETYHARPPLPTAA